MKLRCKYLVGVDRGNSKLRENIDNTYTLKNMFVCKQNVYEGEKNIDRNKYYFVKSDKFSDFFSWSNKENNYIFIESFFSLKNKSKNYIYKIKL